MAMIFPASPVVGDTAAFGGKTWRWNGKSWTTAAATVTAQDWAAIAGKPTIIAAGATLAQARGAIEAVADDDLRLSDARSPRTHTHAMTDVSGLAEALAGKQGSLGFKITVSPTAPAEPAVGDIWIW